MIAQRKDDVPNEEDLKLQEERQNFDTLFWGGVLIWIGLVFWADSAGYLVQFGGAQTWGWIFLGAGVYGIGWT